MDDVLSVLKFRWQKSEKFFGFMTEAGVILKTLGYVSRYSNTFRMVISTAECLFSSFQN